jgi:hypothetical protein
MAMKFRSRPNIAVVINKGEGGDRNKETVLYNAAEAKCVCVYVCVWSLLRSPELCPLRSYAEKGKVISPDTNTA